MIAPFDIYQALRYLRTLGFYVQKHHGAPPKTWFVQAPNLTSHTLEAEELLEFADLVRRSFAPVCPAANDPWCLFPAN
ncbi:MAG TPA: hypothetical protein VGE07_28410 [Herpetosiphonaceae bacterium]